MLMKLLDKLFPVICVGRYRWHCWHYHAWKDLVLPDSDCRHSKTYNILKCCRCAVERYERDGGPM